MPTGYVSDYELPGSQPFSHLHTANAFQSEGNVFSLPRASISSHQEHRSVVSLIDGDSDDEVNNAQHYSAVASVPSEDVWIDLDDEPQHPTGGKLSPVKGKQGRLRFPLPPKPTSWKNYRKQTKRIKEHFKYTDTNGNDLWAFVVTVYNGDKFEVFVEDIRGNLKKVKYNQEEGHVSTIREPYEDCTKYWRDHHVPEDSIERKKPVVLRDAYVPPYSRLSARAQAWRGFIKPKPSLLERLSSPLGGLKHRAGKGNRNRSFAKHRNRYRCQRFNQRTKINLAAISSITTAAPVVDASSGMQVEEAEEPKVDMGRLYAIILENLPEGTTEHDVLVRSLTMLTSYGTS